MNGNTDDSITHDRRTVITYPVKRLWLIVRLHRSLKRDLHISIMFSAFLQLPFEDTNPHSPSEDFSFHRFRELFPRRRVCCEGIWVQLLTQCNDLIEVTMRTMTKNWSRSPINVSHAVLTELEAAFQAICIISRSPIETERIDAQSVGRNCIVDAVGDWSRERSVGILHYEHVFLDLSVCKSMGVRRLPRERWKLAAAVFPVVAG